MVSLKNPGAVFGFTPLNLATITGHICKFIMENIPNNNPVANNGQTRLLLAAEGGYLDIYKLIIRDKNNK